MINPTKAQGEAIRSMSESDSGCPPCCGRVACELPDVSDWEIDDYILHPLHPLERMRLEYRVNSTVPSIMQMNIGVLCVATDASIRISDIMRVQVVYLSGVASFPIVF